MLDAWKIWLIAGIALWIAEVFVPGFVLGVFAAACLVTALPAALGAAPWVQLLVFGVAVVAVAAWLRPVALRWLHGSRTAAATNVEALVGRIARVTEAIVSDEGGGYVRVGGETWHAIVRDGRRIGTGVPVRVTGVDGCTLIVEPTDHRNGGDRS